MKTSEAPVLRIRAQSSPSDENVIGFILDHAFPVGKTTQFDRPQNDAPLSKALFDIPGVSRIQIADATIWVRKDRDADWTTLKPSVASNIRRVMEQTSAPFGDPLSDESSSPDTALLRSVENLLDQQVNPSVAAHGGHIAADRVDDGIVYLRMSGGCQGCAASSATLRDGVERMLRAALPEIREIVDVTDHDEGSNPYYSRESGPSPALERMIPPAVIDWQDGKFVVDPEYLAPRLGLTPETLRSGLRSGEVVGITETGQGEDIGKTRIVMRSPSRAWAAEISADGIAREIPPPRQAKSATTQEQTLASKVRAHLETLPADKPPVTYGALARALGMWAPGSVRKITRALETTMHEDAQAQRPFIAARAVSRVGYGLPGEGFFELAHALARGPSEGETNHAFLAREAARLKASQNQS